MNKKIVITFFSLFSIIAITGSFYYYDTLNSYEDPRIIPARKLITKFEELKVGGTRDQLLTVLDSITEHFRNTSGYQDSYELGVFDNDRAAIYIHCALYKTEGIEVQKTLLVRGAKYSKLAIKRYLKWKRIYGSLDELQLKRRVSQWLIGEKFVERRVELIVQAQLEIDRRLSVAHTNHGIIQRHLGRLEEAADSYVKAIKLWDQNQSAENNLRILMGKKPVKPSFIRKLFPPERLKKI